MSGNKYIVTDASRLIVEAAVRAGAEVFVGYPITPANLLYAYSTRRFPLMLAAPDEITTLQWMSGFSAQGKFPVTATAFPGLALMVESINMAFMMELPMLIVLTQRLGPSTGSATTGADGDLSVVRGMVSGGYELPVFSASSPVDCWELTAAAVHCALQLRTPVILLTSKELVMTQFTILEDSLKEIKKASWPLFRGGKSYHSYDPYDGLVPPFLPLNDGHYQVRINASTHDFSGLTRKATPEALKNTKRLAEKIAKLPEEFIFYDYYPAEREEKLLITYGITSAAAFQAFQNELRSEKNISLLICKTMLPVPEVYFQIIARHRQIIVAEENLNGQWAEILFGKMGIAKIKRINKIAEMITPTEIVQEVVQ